jgi:hypothetical protein
MLARASIGLSGGGSPGGGSNTGLIGHSISPG